VSPVAGPLASSRFEHPVVRRIAAQDKTQWIALWDGYNAFYGRSGDSALPLDVTETTWSRFFDPDEPVEALVACSGSELVGLAHYVLHRTTTAVGHTCYLQDLFTRSDQRGRGIARLFVENVCAEAHTAGAHRVYWQTHRTNKLARTLYDRIAQNLGFIVYRIDL
jgi:GNAT superfamily N-acetyltransferase